MKNTLQQFWRRKSALLIVAGIIVLAAITGSTSARWIGKTFPGFFVLENSVVASVSLPHWSVAAPRRLYQHAVIAVNNQPVTTAAEIYQAVQQLPSGSAITYTLSKDGTVVQATLRSQTFTLKDYVLLFGAYLLTGLVVAGIGVGVWFLKPRAPASHALLSLGLTIGLFFLTANDLYFPHWFFRLHLLSEAFMPAAFVHLAVVFPTDRFLRSRSFLLFTPYWLSFLLSIFHEVFLYQPAVYSMLHGLCELYAGLSSAPFLIGIVWDFLTTDSPLVRRRIRVVALGFFGAFALPAGLTLFSGLTGGGISVNYSVFTMSLFPLSLGYAIVKHDLFEIDTMVKRGVYYLSLTAVLSLFYFALLAVLNFFLHSSEFAQSPFFPLLFTLGAVFLLNPLKDYLQQWIDRVFFRLRYDPEKVLEATSTFLASTLALDDILAFIWNTISETLGVQRGGIFLRATDKSHYFPTPLSMPVARMLSAEHSLIQETLRRRRIFSWYDLTIEPFSIPSPSQQECQETMSAMRAQLIVPLHLKGELLGFIVLGAKESGVFFTANDTDLLHTLANQSTLSIANALAYQEIQGLNTELQGSIVQLENAYRDLQRSQEHLVRSEKMADLGRLTAGIAHEMNTPLGASLASYKMILDLIDEYKKSIGDPEVSVTDHHEIAAEMENLVHNTQQWTERAVAYIRSLKLQTREVKQGEEREFSILQSIEDTKLLLSHRLRNSRCTVTVACSVAAPILRGDPSKFGQVLTNLIGNAMDAYKDTGKNGGEIHLTVAENDEDVELRVRDHGCGIPQENLERIFDDLFTTKPLGEGTGLGLPISRDIVTKFFHGTMRVESIVGQGTTFILCFPRYVEKTKEEETARQKAA
jgi:signal transduction histidine kinase